MLSTEEIEKLKCQQPAYPRSCESCLYQISRFFKYFPECDHDYYCGHPEIEKGLDDPSCAEDCPEFFWLNNKMVKVISGPHQDNLVYPTWWKGAKSLSY